MKLPDVLRRNQDGDPLDERIAAELDALDSALRGEPVDPELSLIATMASDLRADREEIEGDFSARLDAWAAAGFPRGERLGASPSATGSGAGDAFERLRLRFAATPPRRLIGPALAAASVAVVAAVAISQSDQIGGSSTSDGGISPASVGQTTAAPPATPSPSTDGVDPLSVGSAGSGAESGSAQSAGSGPDASGIQSSAKPSRENRLHFLKPGTPALKASGARASADARGGDLGRIRRNRKVERGAQLSLAAEAKDVPNVAARASDVTERYRGHVLSSQVAGSSESAQATLQLAIPSKNLDAAISDLSDLAEVSSRSESSNDITRSFVTARDRLAGYRAERDSVLQRLTVATTDEETAALKSQLKVLNARIADARGSVDKLKNRASISRVTVLISSDGMIGAPSGGESGWGIGDALRDAGHVLTVAGGIALISGAVLLPLAILALLAGLAIRTSRTRARERALDG